MRKLILIIAILTMSVTLTLAQDQTPDWKVMKLKGNVKTLNQTSFEAKYSGDTTQQAGRNIVRGNKAKSRHIYTYTAMENLAFTDQGYIQNAVGYDVNSRGAEYITFKYNKNKIMHESIHYGPTKLIKRIQTYKYDDYGGLTTMRIYGRDKLMMSKTIYKLDRAGNIVEQRQSDNNKQRTGSRKYAYDEKDNCISTMIFDPKGKLVLTLVSESDEKNSITKTTTLDVNRKPSTSSTYSYKYDSLGNWTERTELKDGQPYMITVRDFQYY